MGQGSWSRPRARGRWRLVAAAGAALVAAGVLARVDVDPPRDLPIERRSPQPPPTPAGVEAEDPTEPEWAAVGVWRRTAVSPIGPRRGHAAVWTGQCPPSAVPRSCGELLVWGGHGHGSGLTDGAVYHPASDSWRPLPDAPRNAPQWTSLPAVWTGANPSATHMASGDGDEPRGVAYDPVADEWRVLADAPIEPRAGHTLTWTGAEVVVWGGHRAGADRPWEPLADGAAYDPEADAWRVLAEAPMRARFDHTAIWLPSGELVILGGTAGNLERLEATLDGAVYDPEGDTWRPLPPPGAAHDPPDEWAVAATRDPQQPAGVLALLPLRDAAGQPLLASYDTAAESWSTRPAGPVGLRSGAYAATDGERIVVWGGADPRRGDPLPGVLRYPRTGAWRLAPGDRSPVPGETATWTGRELLTWGGGREGAAWDPNARPDPQARVLRPDQPRVAELPAGHMTNWRVEQPASGEPFAVEARGPEARDVAVWVLAGGEAGGRSQRFDPAETACDAEGCVHRFDALPATIPGFLRVYLHAAGERAVSAVVRIRAG